MGKFNTGMAFFRGADSGWSCLCPIFMTVKSTSRWSRCGALRLEELYTSPVSVQLFNESIPFNGVAVNLFDLNHTGICTVRAQSCRNARMSLCTP